jgi:hypothetical protein
LEEKKRREENKRLLVVYAVVVLVLPCVTEATFLGTVGLSTMASGR